MIYMCMYVCTSQEIKETGKWGDQNMMDDYWYGDMGSNKGEDLFHRDHN